MAFKIDNQTLADLGIFSKNNEESVYQIFNRCRTQGGALLLEQMFRTPLSSADEINHRMDSIRFFMDNPIAFPFTNDFFAPAEFYLSDTDTRNQLFIENNTLNRKMGSIIKGDTQFEQIHKGIISTIQIIKELNNFISNIDNQSIISQCCILPNEVIEQVEKYKSSKKISYENCVSLDKVLRFSYQKEIKAIFDFIYKIDLYYTVAEVSIKRGFKFAKISDSATNIIDLKGVYHPRLQNSVDNDITIDENRNMIFLTGANMAGKSTIMRSIAIAIYTAHVGFPVAVKEMMFTVRSGIFTTINLPDNINAGYSHFYSEVMRLKKVAIEVRQNNNLVIIFDELFRGTNVKDAYDATLAVMEAFSTIKKCTFIVSTHIIEAGEVLKERNNSVQFVYMPTIMDNGVPRYPYKMRQGVTEDRHGMIIINNEGIIDTLKRAFKGKRL